MFSKPGHNFRNSLAIRLTLWYAIIFMITLCIAFTVIYFLLALEFADRTDRDLERQINQFSAMLAIKDIESVTEAAFLETQAAGEKEVFMRMLAPNGEIFSSSSMSHWRHLEVNPKAIRHLLEGKQVVKETVSLPDSQRDVRIIYGFLGPGVIMQFGQALDSNIRFLNALVRIFAVTTVVLFVLALVIGRFLSKRALAGVAAVTLTASRISSDSLQERVVVEKRHGDEIDKLAGAFNTMLDRIEDLVTGIREMNDNIAHDLRSPITRIRGLAEVTLTTGAPPDAYEIMAGNTIEECDRLLDMINTMLMISKTEAGVGHLHLLTLDLSAIVEEACELFRPMAEDRQVTLTCHTAGALVFSGDIKMIQRMISNLLDNAIKYTRVAGEVRVTASKANDNGTINVAIVDSGVGIDAKDLPMIFNRFFRCDESRSLPGTGLGLSLARAVARVHGGDIRVSSRKGAGSTFLVDLPSETTNLPVFAPGSGK
ncbi:MAG: HAMP domain-containing protein [Desulfobacterales bacterium]|nr:HAMP domain-containing protein [Desulfobacterales bacterium]